MAKLPYRVLFIIVLVVSFSLRWALVLEGGQLFNPDEYRYLFCRVIAREIHRENFTEAITELTREAEHQGFKFLCVIPAIMEPKAPQNFFIPGLFFSMFSLINIAIIWFLALRLGADEKESFFATLMAGGSSALFYYSSHLFPYDAAMTFGLLALYVGLRNETKTWTSILTGLLGFLSFFTYNGYWALVGFVFVVHVLFGVKHAGHIISRAALTGCGFFASLFLMVWINGLFGNDLLNGYASFSNTIRNGSFAEGGILPFTYLWATENWLFIIWLLLILYSVCLLPVNKYPSRLIILLGGFLFIYGCLAIPSVALHKFVVYGRLVRQLLPFLILGGAYGLKVISEDKNWGRIASTVLIFFMLVQAGLNLRRSFLITYPAEFAKQVQALYPDFKPPKNMTYFYTDNVIDVGPYKAYYIKYLYPLPKEVLPLNGNILMSAENPLSSFVPFRYEDGFSPDYKVNFPDSFSTMMVVEPNE